MNLLASNCTEGGDFHLQSFAMSGDSKLVIFAVIFSMYLLTILGNVLIISLICLIAKLHTPMYFFLGNLSVLDVAYVSDILPKFLAITKSGDDAITFPACIAQMFILVFCVGTEFLLLTCMAYDRYIAICAPLYYAVVMKKLVCASLAAVSWFFGLINAATQSSVLSRAEYCDSHDIDNFYCDLKMVIKLASSDTSVIQNYLSAIVALMGFLPLVLILVSYICIISTIAKIRSSQGRVKAFSSCSSHITVVILFYGGVLVSYSTPERSQEQDKLLSLLYTALVPLLNPVVYTLRNRDVLRAMKQIKKCLSSKKL